MNKIDNICSLQRSIYKSVDKYYKESFLERNFIVKAILKTFNRNEKYQEYASAFVNDSVTHMLNKHDSADSMTIESIKKNALHKGSDGARKVVFYLNQFAIQ